MKYINIILLLNFLFTQEIINLIDIEYEDPKELPILGGNLKPEMQPEWTDPDFLEKLDELNIQMLRWPGAEASNFFDWNKGKFMPCYKWEKTPCYSAECPHQEYSDNYQIDYIDYCNSNGVSLCDGSFYARDIQPSLLDDGAGDGSCIRNKNIISNFASDYMETINNQLNKKLTPFFVLNIVDPSYYDPSTFDCTGDNIEKNSIIAQLDTISALAYKYDIPSSDIYIQLSNEPFKDHYYLPWREGGEINAEKYAEYAVNALSIIRNHPSNKIKNSKVAIHGDIHSDEPESCEDNCLDDFGEVRCNWNQDIWSYANNNSSDEFDAISYQKYTGLRNMKIPNFDPTNCVELPDDNWVSIDITNMDQANNGFGALFGETNINEISCEENNIMNYLIKWMIIDLDRLFGRLNGDCTLGPNNFFDELTNSQNIDIWVTEHDFGLDDNAITDKPYQGTWSHAIHFLYETLSYIEKVPSIKVIIGNNVNGFSGNYRLIDTYAIEDNNGTNACTYHTSSSNSDCYNLCANKYLQLSPKGETMKLLYELAVRNETLQKINFGDEVSSTTIKQYQTDDPIYTFNVRDLHAWSFPENNDFLFINVSENDYQINLDGKYFYTIITTDNLFAKNYYKENSVDEMSYCSWDSENDGECDVINEVFQWEFDMGSAVPDLNSYFSSTANLIIENDLINTNELLLIPPHSVVKAENRDGYSYNPATTELKQNYPNPFNIQTTIEYTLEQPEFVSLKIYDIMGRLVKTLVDNQYKEAHYIYSTIWDGTNNQGNQMASGIYIYSLQLGSNIQTKKMILLK